MKDNGGQAFPSYVPGDSGYYSGPHFEAGLTLRDYFAAKIIEGRVAGRCAELGNEGFNNDTCMALAKVSYKLADAMIAERNKP